MRFHPSDWVDAARRSEIGHLAHWIQARGLADKRRGLLVDTVFVKRASRGGEFAMLLCFPAFVKLRWRAGETADDKVYLLARVEEVGPRD